MLFCLWYGKALSKRFPRHGTDKTLLDNWLRLCYNKYCEAVFGGFPGHGLLQVRKTKEGESRGLRRMPQDGLLQRNIDKVERKDRIRKHDIAKTERERETELALKNEFLIRRKIPLSREKKATNRLDIQLGRSTDLTGRIVEYTDPTEKRRGARYIGSRVVLRVCPAFTPA